MHLTCLVYYSENRLDPSDGPVLGALQRILSISKRNNAACGITGALAFDNFWFFQALEGERDKVWSTFMRIMDDTRHGEVTLVGCLPIETRLFDAWSMRLMRVSDATSLFAPFTLDGVLRPSLMREADIVSALQGMIATADRPPAPSASVVGERVRRDVLPGAAPVAP